MSPIRDDGKRARLSKSRRRGAPDEFTSLYVEWGPRLLAAARIEVRDPDHADDIVQEAFVRACVHWSKVRRLDAPESWLFRVVYNLIRSKWRRATVARRVLEGLAREPRADTGQAAIDAVVDRDEAASLLAQLPPELSEVLALRYLEGRSVDETAALLAQPTGTVKSRSHRALMTARRAHVESAKRETRQ